MTNSSMERVIWLRVAGFMALTVGYLSMHRHVMGLDLMHRTLILLAVVLVGTAIVMLWRVDRAKMNSIWPLAVIALVFGTWYGSALLLWRTKWEVVPMAAFGLAVLLGPLLTLRRRRPSP